MKKTFIAAWIVSAITHAQAQQITFSETSHDFGLIEEKDGNVHYDFHFTNTGDKPLVIKQVITGCGCTSAKWSKKEYLPGEKGTVQIIYHPERREMELFSIPSEVFTNLKVPATLTITGKVNLASHPCYNVFDPTKGKKAEFIPSQPMDDYELILQRVRQQMYQRSSISKMDKSAIELMKSLNAEGKWPQLDYSCFFRTNWEPLEHVNRIKKMALAYTCPKSSLYGNEILFQAIEKAAQTWNLLKPTSFNWWFNDIASPRAMSEVLALMEAGKSKLPATIVKGWMTMMEKSDPRKKTGANKMDIAVHHMLRGCILKNDSIVNTNINEFFQPVCIADYEGIMKDFSYQQHGKQLYIGGYGIVFVDNIVKVAPLFVGTNYALTGDKLELFSKFIRNSFLNTFRSKYIDFSVCGRSISRKNILDVKESAGLFDKMKQLDPQHALEYEDAAQRFTTLDPTIGRTAANTLFYLSDYMLHNRKKYDFSIRAVSNRTCRSESGNGENLLGTYVSEGATSIRVDGDEYLNIFPVWEWDKIPGTTTPAGEVKNTYEWGVLGKSDFVGGVSDGLYGVMAYDMDDYNLKAHKGWFLFDDEIVCLGAGINSEEMKDINTSVNQCHLVGDVFTSQNGKLSQFTDNQQTISDFKGWLWHNKVGYYFPQSTSLTIKKGPQSGRWSRINFNQSAEDITLPVFNTWIQHGTRPQDEGYVYFIVPGFTDPNALTTYDVKAIEILSNTANLQAVYNKQLDILQVIFYQAGELNYGGKTITAKMPCAAMFKGMKTEKPMIQVTDPTQKKELIIGKDLICQ